MGISVSMMNKQLIQLSYPCVDYLTTIVSLSPLFFYFHVLFLPKIFLPIIVNLFPSHHLLLLYYSLRFVVSVIMMMSTTYTVTDKCVGTKHFLILKNLHHSFIIYYSIQITLHSTILVPMIFYYACKHHHHPHQICNLSLSIL